MKKGFRVSNIISFNISNHHQTNHHTYPPLLRLFSSSSYNNNNNRSNDGYSGGGRPPPRRRSGDGYTSSNRSQSSSRPSGSIDGNNHRVSGEYRGRKPNYYNDSKYRASNIVDNRDNRRSGGNTNCSYVPFNDDIDDDDEQNPQNAPGNPRRQVSGSKIDNKMDNKIQDVDGFLDRFKLGLDDEKNKPSFDKLDSGKVSGEGEVAAEEERLSPPEDADEIFRKMKETGLIPNAVAMLHGLCQDGLVQDAMKLFGVMRERGSIPEVVIYTAVVEGFCKAQKPDEAIRIFRKMQSNGIAPNAFSYGVLVQGLIKGKQLDDGLEFCLEMVEAGHSPNLATFTGLVNAFCKERGLESAQLVIGKLTDKGFGFDEKGVRDFMEKKGPFSPMVWEAILGKKKPQML